MTSEEINLRTTVDGEWITIPFTIRVRGLNWNNARTWAVGYRMTGLLARQILYRDGWAVATAEPRLRNPRRCDL
jgi:hypothetical protein